MFDTLLTESEEVLLGKGLLEKTSERGSWFYEDVSRRGQRDTLSSDIVMSHRVVVQSSLRFVAAI